MESRVDECLFMMWTDGCELKVRACVCSCGKRASGDDERVVGGYEAR